MGPSKAHTNRATQQFSCTNQKELLSELIYSIFRRLKKSSDFETEVLESLDCLQKAQAKIRNDLRQIIREELKNVLNERNKRGWHQIA